MKCDATVLVIGVGVAVVDYILLQKPGYTEYTQY